MVGGRVHPRKPNINQKEKGKGKQKKRTKKTERRKKNPEGKKEHAGSTSAPICSICF